MCIKVKKTVSSVEGWKAIERGVCDGIAGRSGDWFVWIFEPHGSLGYVITIEGPHGKWERTFFDGHEHSADRICERVKQLLGAPPKRGPEDPTEEANVFTAFKTAA